jgi:methyl-accepting chemotaxis protein
LALAGLSTVSIGNITYVLMKHHVLQPVMQGRQAAMRLAAGDLTNQVHVHDGDDVGQILLAVNGISVGLTGLVGNVRLAASMVTDGPREIADGCADIRASQLNGLVASES